MYKIVTLACISLIGCTGCSFGADAEQVSGSLPAQVAWDLKHISGGPVQVQLSNCRLLQGASCSELRTLAQCYANAYKSALKECPFSELLYGYKNTGRAYIAGVFNDAVREYEKTGKPVVVYISDIDFVTASHDHVSSLEYTAALDALRVQVQEKEYEGKLFFIFSAQESQHVPQRFLENIDCTIITAVVATTIESMSTSFFETFFGKDGYLRVTRLIDKLDDNNDQYSVAKSLGLRSYKELFSRLSNVESLADSFFDCWVINKQSGVTQEDFTVARERLLQACAEHLHVTRTFMKECEDALGGKSSDAITDQDRLCFLVYRDLFMLLDTYLSRLMFLCEHDDLIQPLIDAVCKMHNNYEAKQLAQKIVCAAEVENGGVLTREIVERIIAQECA